MTSILYAVFLMALVATAMADDGTTDDTSDYCDTSVEQNLDMQRLKGEWWEEESFNTDSFVEPNDKCHVSRFYPTADNKIHVNNDYISSTNNEHKKYSYVIIDKDPKSDGNLTAKMNILKPPHGKDEVYFDVLDTDYDNYMLAQICHDAPGTDDDFKAGLLLVRKPKGVNLDSVEIKTQLKASLKANNLDRSYFQANRINYCAAVMFPDTFTAEE